MFKLVVRSKKVVESCLHSSFNFTR